MMPEKIPVVLLLKYSRQEVGELKAEIDELKDIINQKNKEIKKLNEKLVKHKDLSKFLKPELQIKHTLKQFDAAIKYIKDTNKPKRNKKRLRTYNKAIKYYNAWFDGCKALYLIIQQLK